MKPREWIRPPEDAQTALAEELERLDREDAYGGAFRLDMGDSEYYMMLSRLVMNCLEARGFGAAVVAATTRPQP